MRTKALALALEGDLVVLVGHLDVLGDADVEDRVELVAVGAGEVELDELVDCLGV